MEDFFTGVLVYLLIIIIFNIIAFVIYRIQDFIDNIREKIIRTKNNNNKYISYDEIRGNNKSRKKNTGVSTVQKQDKIETNVSIDSGLKKENKRTLYKSPIQEILEKRKIKYLVHFTNINNVESILKYGLCDINTLWDKKIDYYYNDKQRLDNNLGCVCLSIEYPNCKFLYKLTETTNKQFCIIVLDAQKVLLENKNKKFFFPNNAAAKTSINRGNQTDINAFLSMFDSKYRDINLPNNMPTDLQAEIQFEGRIPVSYISRIEFQDENTLQYFINNVKNIEDFQKYKNLFYISNYYFKKRSLAIETTHNIKAPESILKNIPQKIIVENLARYIVLIKYIENIISKIPQEKFTEEIAQYAIKFNVDNIQYIPVKLMTKEMCEEVVKANGNNIQYVPHELITKEMSEYAIKKEVDNIQCLPPNLITTELLELLESIVINETNNIKSVPNMYKTPKMCEEVVKANGDNIQYIPKELITQEMCEKAIKTNGNNIQYIPDMYKNQEICNLAISENVNNIIYIPDEYKTKEICKISMANPNNIKYIPKNLLNEDICKSAVLYDESLIKYILPKMQNKLENWKQEERKKYREITEKSPEITGYKYNPGWQNDISWYDG